VSDETDRENIIGMVSVNEVWRCRHCVTIASIARFQLDRDIA
jgi:hypothetical protein